MSTLKRWCSDGMVIDTEERRPKLPAHGNAPPYGPLLVLDVHRLWEQRQDVRRRHHLPLLLRVVLVEELEPRVLHRIPGDVRLVRVDLLSRRTPAVHVDHDLAACVQSDPLVASEHVAT